MKYKELSLKEKIGQKFIFGVYSDNIDIIIELIRNYAIGGVILYKKNYRNYDEMLDVIKRLKNANKHNKVPLFIAIDQEGGKVNRMPSEFDNVKNVYDLSKYNSDLISDVANLSGKMLSSCGINMNFAPVMDIYDGNPKNKALYKRCFYGDVENISNCGYEYVKGLTNHNVISVIKHFPGHGISHVDSHFMTPYVFNYKKILDEHIKPFCFMIDKNVDAMMVGHLVIRKFTKFLPGSISFKFINKFLREENNFRGLVITDEINMLFRSFFYSLIFENKAITACSDIILVKIRNKNNGKRLINKYEKIVNRDKRYAKKLDESVERILKIKEKYNITDNTDNLGCNIDEINSEIRRINSY